MEQRREFQLMFFEGHLLRLISVEKMSEVMQVNTRNFTEQELGLVLVRALNVPCVKSDTSQIAMALKEVAFAINHIKLPLQRGEWPSLQQGEQPSGPCWAIIDRFATAVRVNESGESGDEAYREYLKARDTLANAML